MSKMRKRSVGVECPKCGAQMQTWEQAMVLDAHTTKWIEQGTHFCPNGCDVVASDFGEE